MKQKLIKILQYDHNWSSIHKLTYMVTLTAVLSAILIGLLNLIEGPYPSKHEPIKNSVYIKLINKNKL
jgi:hypothetical protein